MTSESEEAGMDMWFKNLFHGMNMSDVADDVGHHVRDVTEGITDSIGAPPYNCVCRNLEL